MKFTTNRAEFLAQVKIVEKAVSSHSAVDVLKGILVEADPDQCEVTLTGTNYEAAIQCKVGCPVEIGGSAVINAKLFVQMLTLLGDDTVTLTISPTMVATLLSGEAVYQVSTISGSSYPKPELPFPEDAVRIKNICSLARNTVFAVSKKDDKPVMKGVRLALADGTIRACGCDGHRMMESYTKSDHTGKLNLIIPAHSLDLLARLTKDDDELDVGIAERNAVFTKENFLFSARLLYGEYLDVDKLMSNLKADYIADANAGEVTRALDTMRAIAGSSSYVNLVYESGALRLACHSDSGQSSVSVPAEVKKVTAPKGFYYSIEHLYEAFRRLTGMVALQISSVGMLFVKTENVLYFQIPMQPKAKAEKAKARTKAKAEKAA